MPLIRKGPEIEPPRAPDPGPSAGAITGSADQRWAAARALGATAADIGILAKALAGETDVRVREAIFTSLVRAASPESVQAIVPYLRSDDAAVRTSALDALRSIPRASSSQMPALLADPDPDVRLLACEIARELPQGQATDLLSALLDREDQVNVCASAVEVLAEAGSSGAIPALQRCARRFEGEPFLTFSIRLTIDRLDGAR